MVLMLSATFTGLILNHYESKLAACLVLNAYIPMLSGTGGNSGTQASVAVIRALSLDEVDFSDLLQVLWKELHWYLGRRGAIDRGQPVSRDRRASGHQP